MPVIPFTQPRPASTPAGILSPLALYSLLGAFIAVLLAIATVSNYRAWSRRDTRSRNTVALPFWTLSLDHHSSDLKLKLKSLPLGTGLSPPTSVRLCPTVGKESPIVRGSRMTSLSSCSSDELVLPPLAIYASGSPSLAHARQMSMPKVMPYTDIGLDTPPPTPIIAPPTCLEDLIRHRAEASNQYALPSSDSASSDLSASSSRTSLLDAFPTPPASIGAVRTSVRASEELYPTPSASPSVPVSELFELPTPNVPFVPAATPLPPITPSRPMSASNSGLLVLDHIFAPSSPSSSSICEATAVDGPECPRRQSFSAFKVPMFMATYIPVSASFRASVEFAAARGYLTPPASPLRF